MGTRNFLIFYLCNSKTFQDGNGNGYSEEIHSNDFLDGIYIGSLWKWRGDCGGHDGNGNGNSSEFQDGNGNSNFREINSQEYQDCR